MSFSETDHEDALLIILYLLLKESIFRNQMNRIHVSYKKCCKNQYNVKWTYVLFCKDFRVAAFTVIGIIKHSLKTIGLF